VESFQTMTKKQQEIAADSFTEFQDMAKDLGKMDPSAASLSKSTDAYRKMFEKMSSNVEELAELANKSQSEIWTILSNRWKENMSVMQPAKAAPKKAAAS
ncbi:MAG: TIGR01841 family phasin, partial [Alphaproteobacteria bacterium]|nr:TIGR01841 family phasin [Alphaproteobacteria bacterium]